MIQYEERVECEDAAKMYFDVMSERLCDVVVVEGRPESDDDKVEVEEWQVEWGKVAVWLRLVPAVIRKRLSQIREVSTVKVLGRFCHENKSSDKSSGWLPIVVSSWARL